jgi:hypothetical protein
MLDAPTYPKPGKFVIIPPTLTEEQRREYVQYEEAGDRNLNKQQ